MTLYHFFLVILLTLVSSITTARSQELPLWELGIGTGVLALPHYRGAEQSRIFAIPFPVIIYRGKHLSIDEGGAHGHLFNSENINLELSLAGGVPVTSNGGGLRNGMPNLDPTAEVGPSLEAKLWQNDNRNLSLRLNLPLRAALSVSLEKIDYQGWTFSPFIEYVVESQPLDRWKLGLSWGPLYASTEYHRYFYAVSNAYATTSREAHDARGGYSGHRVTLTLQKKNRDLWLGAFVRYDDLNNAEFLDSPLVNSRQYLAAGIGFTWIFSKATTLVDRADD